MSSLKECYMCGGNATTVEHVPPKCLFPEKKDVYGLDVFKKNLISVPSCEEHNLKKSSDDEYLMISLSGVVGNNALALHHLKTKGKRSLDRKRLSLESYLENPEKMIYRDEDGNSFPVYVGFPDTDRLRKCFEYIGYGLYYKEFEKVFRGECQVIIGFLKYENELDQIIKTLNKRIEFEGERWKTKGGNPDIFKYQFGSKDELGLIGLKLTFYGKAEVFISFKDESISLPFLT